MVYTYVLTVEMTCTLLTFRWSERERGRERARETEVSWNNLEIQKAEKSGTGAEASTTTAAATKAGARGE